MKTKMSTIIEQAVKTLSTSVNVSTGLSHPNDMNKAREIFKVLHANDEIILKSDVVAAAQSHGWSAKDADELGSLAQQIGEGKNPRVSGGPWWAADIYETLKSRC